MTQLHFPWLILLALLPLLGAAWTSRIRDATRARMHALAIAALTFFAAAGMWWDFVGSGSAEACDAGDPVHALTGRHWLTIDELSAPLLPLVALIYLLTSIATPRSKLRRFSFGFTLLSEAVLLLTFACREPWGVVALLSLHALLPCGELQARKRPIRVYGIHMGLFVLLLAGGLLLLQAHSSDPEPALWVFVPLAAAVLIRSGIFPFHCWVSDLVDNLTLGSALLFVTPMVGAYAAARLLIPLAPDAILRGFGLVSLATAVYASAMTLVQTEARRFFAFLCISHSALVLVGLETVSRIGLTGGLCVWISASFALAGFGLTLRLLEARHGRLSLTRFHGLYEHTPLLAICFLLTGMASVGFPGTLGFIGGELLIDGAVQTYPHVGIAVILAAALNGIAVVKTYFRLFTGTRHVASVPLAITGRERLAVSIVAAVILVGGLCPQLQVQLCHQAARSLLSHRKDVEADGHSAGTFPASSLHPSAEE